MMREVKQQQLPVYVFIDASNIRRACLGSCGFYLDFTLLMKYLKKRYSGLKESFYFEGIAFGDTRQANKFSSLQRIGYEIRSLERKSYIDEAVTKTYYCSRCGHGEEIEILPESHKMKSNVDVYLATEMMAKAIDLNGESAQFILLSCDGDYQELIRELLSRYSNLKISVMATPYIHQPDKKSINYLSTRLIRPLLREFSGRYELIDISSIKKYITASQQKCGKHRSAAR